MQIKAIEIQIIDIEFIPILRKALKSTKAQLLTSVLLRPSALEIDDKRRALTRYNLSNWRFFQDKKQPGVPCHDSAHAKVPGRS